MFTLRPYQQNAVDSVIQHIKKCTDPCLLELATGAGKSLIVAEIAKWIKDNSGKKVLCLAPSKELVSQNRSKYLTYGEPASIFSASAGRKEMRHSVVFGSPVSVLNSINSFGSQFAAVVIDEAHGITKGIKEIIKSMKDHNPKLRVIGLTATPYRMGSGYIYEIDENNILLDGSETKNPFFKKLLCRVSAEELIDMGYLTKPIADIKTGYDTSQLEKKNGKFTAESIEKSFEGQGRKTSEIVAQVVDISTTRKGVMFFAATIQHAQEIIESLPVDNSEIVTGKTPKKERENIIERFVNKRFKYLVNVSVLTTGFDAPHVDVIAILRATESAGLLQQIIGRGLRLDEGKKDCLVLDFAENIERHQLDNNLFKPEIKVTLSDKQGAEIDVVCPLCSTVNEFTMRPNPDELQIDENGNFVDLTGQPIMVEEQPLPAHYGRRCTAHNLIAGTLERCNGRWSYKVCSECDNENDIAARYCSDCRHELVDPNEKLKLDFKRIKSSPHEATSDKVLRWYCQKWTSKKGNISLRVDWTTEYRTFSAWYSPDSRTAKGQYQWVDLCKSVFGYSADSIDLFIEALQKNQGTMPATIKSRKQGDFFTVISHNEPEDVIND